MIPTLNEIDALPRLLQSLDQTIAENPHLAIDELVFVDDGSTDGTLDFLSSLEGSGRPYRVVVISRKLKGGSGGAEIVGIGRASSDWVLKMDSDGQHPAEFIPALAQEARADLDLVIGSRYTVGGGNQWPAIRGLISRMATAFAHLLLPESRGISDPLSGFYMARRSLVSGLDSQRTRYKALLHILAARGRVRFREVPFTMAGRKSGSSKIVGTSGQYILRFTIELLGYARISSQRRSRTRRTLENFSTSD